MKIFKCGKYSLELGKKTYIMGILNVTPDSFSDGGKWLNAQKAIKRAFEIEKEGANILDIGAQSTRPGYTKISPDEELDRLFPVLEGIKRKLNIPISIDTFYPKTASEALLMGADIINDVYGFENEGMFEVCKGSDCGIIITYGFEGIEMKNFFENKLKKAANFGIDLQRMCFDPGIGFSKNYQDDLDIIKNIKKYKIPQNAFLVGVSRKRVIGYTCGNPPAQDRVAGSLSAGVIASINGADILRVHDVKETVQALKISDKICKEREKDIGQDSYQRAECFSKTRSNP
ncbi:MAG: dihydropteroate synthase [Oscillospiraceae bacterium]|jgi:dihydropteroate synthase|nr:dihydropteroate synthase [Oscillospiraceae bacterium]